MHTNILPREVRLMKPRMTPTEVRRINTIEKPLTMTGSKDRYWS